LAQNKGKANELNSPFPLTKSIAEEKDVKSAVKNIAAAMERYKVIKGYYPFTMDDLFDTKPPCLSKTYAQNLYGYKYSFEVVNDTYKITAAPRECLKTGYKVFILEKGKKIFEYYCHD
jgi:Tfp pilus assembly protein PilE